MFRLRLHVITTGSITQTNGHSRLGWSGYTTTTDSIESEQPSPTEAGDEGLSFLYRGVMAAVVLFALGTVAVGSIGIYTVLTGGTDTDDPDVLGAYECNEFDADLEMGHEAEYATEREIQTAHEVGSFETAVTDAGIEAELRMTGGLLNASARAADGTTLPVEQSENSVVVRADDASSFRLWIDSVTKDGTVTRTQLDICPPR